MSTAERDYRDAIQQLPSALQRLMDLERFHLYKTEMFQQLSRDPGFDTRFLPQNCGAFRLPCFWIRRKYLQVYGHQFDAGAEQRFVSGGEDEQVLFPVHPTVLPDLSAFLSKVDARDAAHDGVCIWAVPTSSTRTLLAWPDLEPEKAIFIKVSLHSPIFGDRRIDSMRAARSVGLSGLVRDSQPELSAALSYFPEHCGFVLRRAPGSGAVLRSIPREVKEGQVTIAPLFSLLGASGGRAPMLLTILERIGMEPLQFIDNALCEPFAKLWLVMSLQHGLIFEAHGQDVLLALSPELRPLGQFYYRDFEGLQVDWDLRRRRGWPAPHGMPHDWSWRETYATWGYIYSDLLWYKWRISLFGHMCLVLREIELSLRDWHDRAVIVGCKCADGEVTMIFSRHLFRAVEDMFGVRISPQYDVYHHLNRFLLLLLKLRRQMLEGMLSQS